MWPKDRREELAKLQELCDVANQINQGSGAIERVQRVIELAGELLIHDYDNDRPSFTQFLVGQATQSMTAIKYNTLGVPTNLPDNDPVLLYGMDGLDAEGPVLGQWDSTFQAWTDHKYGQIDWHPMFFAVPPENPCKSVAEPTCNNEVA